MANKKIFWLLIILLVIIIFIFFVRQVIFSNKISASKRAQEYFANLEQQIPVINKENPRFGNQQAKLVIFEFADFECPYCAEMEKTMAEIMKKYSDKILLIWKDYPLHDQSGEAAIAGRCANEQGKFWDYEKILFQKQNQLSQALYLETAQTLNLDLTKFQTCFNDSATKKIVETDLSEGVMLKVNATPYFFIGQTRVSGVINYQQFAAIIDGELAKID